MTDDSFDKDDGFDKDIDFSNPYWRLGVELDDRFSMEESIRMRREERKLLLEIEKDDIERY